MTDYDIDVVLDSYWGDTPSSYSGWHDEMFVGAGNDYWIYFLPSGSATWWRMRPWGTDNLAPDHIPDTSSPYDWWEGTTAQKEVQPLNARNGIVPDFAGNYWSHAVPDRWGTHIAYSDTQGAYVAPGVWDVESSVRTAFPNEAKAAQYHAWTGWTDYTTGTDGANNIYYMKYNDGLTHTSVSSIHATTGSMFTRPGQSPDGTKTAYRSDFLQSTSINGDVFYVVTEYPYPPEITQTAASGGTVTIRADWRLSTSPRGYTQRGWPNEDTDNPPPPREIEKFRLWRSSDGSNWEPVGTVDYEIFSKYDFSDGTWLGNDYWEMTDAPGDGTWYYAVTSKEWSGLESRTLSNVYRVTVSGGIGTGTQTNAYPSNPGGDSDFYNSFDAGNTQLIRYYNIYAEDGSAPTADQTNRIASIHEGACADGICSWVDWLGSTSGNTNHVVTPVDTQGNEGSALSFIATHRKTPATASGQYTIEWSALSGPSGQYCPDTACNGTENCQSCPQDCPTPAGQVCCSGTLYAGNCCEDASCTALETCISHVCTDQQQCTDQDNDGYGNPASPTCTYSELDCNDGNSSINPGAQETCGDGIDYDCDSQDSNGYSLGTSCGGGNLALSKPVTAGSSDWGALETYIVDGIWDQTGIGWSADAVPNWVEIDLEQDYQISRISIGPYMRSSDTAWNYNDEWSIRYRNSTDAQWRDFMGVSKLSGAGTLQVQGISITDGNPGHRNSDDSYKHYNFTFDPADARYIRYDVIVGDLDDDSNGNEIQVYGSGSGAIVCDGLYSTTCNAFHRADSDQDCVISQPELLAWIGEWYMDSTAYPMWEMMEAVGYYYAGNAC